MRLRIIIVTLIALCIISSDILIISIVACFRINVWHSADERDDNLYSTYIYETGKKDDTQYTLDCNTQTIQIVLIRYAESMLDANLIRQVYSINYGALFVTESIQYII